MISSLLFIYIQLFKGLNNCQDMYLLNLFSIRTCGNRTSVFYHLPKEIGKNQLSSFCSMLYLVQGPYQVHYDSLRKYPSTREKWKNPDYINPLPQHSHQLLNP